MKFDSRFDSLKRSALSPNRDLAKCIKSRTDLEVLLFLRDHSDGWFEDIEIHRHTQSSRREVFAALYALADSGLVRRRSNGIQVSYGLTENAGLRASVMGLKASQGEGLARPSDGVINER
jgi:hypothetical protein